jgi:hypothetical protein
MKESSDIPGAVVGTPFFCVAHRVLDILKEHGSLIFKGLEDFSDL